MIEKGVRPVASWPDYGAQQITVVGDDGQVYALQMLEGGRLVGTSWNLVGPPVPGSKAAQDARITAGGTVDRFATAVDEWHATNFGRASMILAAPDFVEQMTQEMERRTGKIRDPRNTRSEILGIELLADARVPMNVGVLVDGDSTFVGAVVIL